MCCVFRYVSVCVVGNGCEWVLGHTSTFECVCNVHTYVRMYVLNPHLFSGLADHPGLHGHITSVGVYSTPTTIYTTSTGTSAVHTNMVHFCVLLLLPTLHRVANGS